MPKFINTTTGQELTAGQALDVWLVSEPAQDFIENYAEAVHFFADACDGFRLERAALETAGIEIKFGEAE